MFVKKTQQGAVVKLKLIFCKNPGVKGKQRSPIYVFFQTHTYLLCMSLRNNIFMLISISIRACFEKFVNLLENRAPEQQL